MMTHDVI